MPKSKKIQPLNDNIDTENNTLDDTINVSVNVINPNSKLKTKPNVKVNHFDENNNLVQSDTLNDNSELEPEEYDIIVYSIDSGELFNDVRRKYRISEQSLADKIGITRHSIRNLFFADTIEPIYAKHLIEMINDIIGHKLSETELNGIIEKIKREKESITALNDNLNNSIPEIQTNKQPQLNENYSDVKYWRDKYENARDEIQRLSIKILTLENDLRFEKLKSEMEMEKKETASLSDGIKTLAENLGPALGQILMAKAGVNTINQ